MLFKKMIALGLILWGGFLGTEGFLQAQRINPLIEAIRQGTFQQAEALIQQAASQEREFQERDEDGRTTLMWAAFKGNLNLVKQLVAHGASLEAKDENGMTSLMYAAIEGHADTVTWLIRQRADFNGSDHRGKTPLILAAIYGQTNVVRDLLDFGANPQARDHNGMTALQLIEFKNYPEITTLLRNFRMVSPKKRALPSPQEMKPVRKTQPSPAPKLRKTSPPPEMPPEEKHEPTGQEPFLWQAAMQGNQKTAFDLVKSGTYVDARDPDGMSALMWATRYNQIQMVQRLLSLDANLHLKEYIYNWNALMWAGRYGHINIVKLLINQGADLQAKDKFNWTVLDIALAHHQKEIVRFLEELQ